MKSDGNTNREISSMHAAIAGGTAGAVTRAIAQPFDVLKIRFQLQLEPIKYGSKYSSLLQASSSIIKEEGLTALWSGHLPAQCLSISYGLIQFATFEKIVALSNKVNSNSLLSHKHTINFVSGALAATIATIASFPFDTVRTRLIAEQKTNKAYKGFSDAFKSMVRHEGSLSLFKGLLPTLGSVAPHAGMQFFIYKLFTDSIFMNVKFLSNKNRSTNDKPLSVYAYLIAGSIAGFVSKAVVYPFDLLKKRLQIQGFQQYRNNFGRQMYCSGMMNCFHLTIREEGYLGLYKGFWPSIFKAVLVSALHFGVYDEIKHLLF